MVKEKDSVKPVSELEMDTGSEKKENKKLSNSEISSLVISLYNDGKNQSEIGLILKKEYGILSLHKITGKRVLDILSENKLTSAIPEDLTFLLKKSVALQGHMKANNKDYTAKRGYQITVSKIRALADYYKKRGILPKDWIYDSNKAALLVR